MNMELIITGLFSALLGGLVSFFALLKLSFVSTIKEDNERLREEIELLKNRVTECEKREREALEREIYFKNKLTLLETAHTDLPFPQWLKDMNGVMLSVNAAYESLFLKPIGKKASDYIGHTDFDIWPEEVAEKFVENDHKVKKDGTYWMGLEPIWIKDSDISNYWKIAKYGRFVGRVCVGIAGIAIPVLDTEIIDNPSLEFIKHLVRKNKIKKALDHLNKTITDADDQRNLSLIHSRFSRWLQSEGKKNEKDRDIEKNNIIDAILSLVDNL